MKSALMYNKSVVLHICIFTEMRRETKKKEKYIKEEEIMNEYDDNDELDDKDLITIVKVNPFLYNKSEKLYSNIEVNKLAWTTVREGLSKKKRLISICTIYLFEICQMFKN